MAGWLAGWLARCLAGWLVGVQRVATIMLRLLIGAFADRTARRYLQRRAVLCGCGICLLRVASPAACLLHTHLPGHPCTVLGAWAWPVVLSAALLFVDSDVCACVSVCVCSVLLGALRAAVVRPFQRLPAVHAVFLAEAGGCTARAELCGLSCGWAVA